ncbi:MAG TPA: preprotein translocase subunit SecG [Xanthobacteraceae bacterium]|nr:preprotein translocase subunit SecG [Xanthobacteraceae bacterium]
MQTVIIVIHLMVVLAMIGVVLLQKSEGGGLGMGGGGGFLSSRGTANVLTRTTAILAAVFFSTSLILSILAGVERKPTSIFGGSGGVPAGQSQPGSSGPAAPGGSLLDQFQGQPAQPSTPQAPRSQ